MARISRIVVPGYPHQVTQRGVRSMDVFDSDEDRWAYLGFRETSGVRLEFRTFIAISSHGSNQL